MTDNNEIGPLWKSAHVLQVALHEANLAADLASASIASANEALDKAFQSGPDYKTLWRLGGEQARRLQEERDIALAEAEMYQRLWLRRKDRCLELVDAMQSVTLERDMLARRCAERARQDVSPAAGNSREALGEAIRTMQRGGVR